MRKSVKHFVYANGLARSYHRHFNRRQLTVVMFHRVLAEDDPRWAAADPVWTVSESLFHDCLRFFVEHYQAISLDDMLAAREDATCLPERSLLITFDDGWADNAEYAMRALRQYGLPAVVFVVAESVNQREPWDEWLRHAWRRGSIPSAHWDALWAVVMKTSLQTAPDASHVEQLIARMIPLDTAERDHVLGILPGENGNSRALSRPMLSSGQLKELLANRIAIGSHGMTHTPIPLARHPEQEMRDSQLALKKMLQPGQQDVLSLSFPHGIHNQRCMEEARRMGYEFLFTSEPHLNAIEAGKPLPRLLGRIQISPQDITASNGKLDPALLAFWLFRRNRNTQ